ncbi:hypothetical protein PMAL9190_01020 [Photobacterium malacitanum]|uniref:Uncharacterized protein n=1 Tax=Photobacterium malacitanum TaxID=2204294 RepID=A0A1Y6MBU1_9GAMM|nr:hypothetical protein [Photobacterium malacitanum]SMY33389.1 hypothetical protein PMAL9190_01020 [Photobacterium malacitanum]
MGLDIPSNYRLIGATKLLAVFVVIGLIQHIETLVHALRYDLLGMVPVIVTLLVLISGVVACVGLLRGQKWGFIPLYFYIPAVTLFLQFSLIPFIPNVFPAKYHDIAIMVINGLVLLYSVLLLLRRMETNYIQEY